MRKYFILLSFFIFSIGSLADTYVKGYTRRDGTYVRPHIRASPDSFKWNNYGPSKRDSELMNPKLRDYDRDGIANYLDHDDDNDAISDDRDSHQYRRSNDIEAGTDEDEN